jgi:transglutaminase-like putative cysteine protease
VHLQGNPYPTSHLPAPKAEQTLAWMAKFALRGEATPEIRLLAEKITRKLNSKDYLSEYAAILNWVRVNIRYSRDPRTIEQVKLPHVTLQTGTGDCDDLATLIGGLILSLGGSIRFVAGAYRGGPTRDGQPVPSHVWVEAFDPSSGWVVLDPVPGRSVNNMLASLVKRWVQPVA